MTTSDKADFPAPGVASTPWRTRSLTLIVVGLSLLAGWTARRIQRPADSVPNSVSPAESAAEDASPQLSRGEVLFHVHCAKCHGPDGRGDAESMARLRPPPRDFAERPWRFGMTFDSIRRVIADGIPGTSMAAQSAALSAGQLDLLTEHVLRMAKQLPVVERKFTPEQQRLVALGFDIERQPSPVPNLTLEAGGGALSLSELRGSWVILEFWGIDCEPCRTALPALQRLSIAGIGEHVKILPVCVDADDSGTAQGLLSQIAPGLTAYVDSTGIGLARFGVQSLPMTWLIDPDGRLRATCIGAIDWDSHDVRKAFEALLAPGLAL